MGRAIPQPFFGSMRGRSFASAPADFSSAMHVACSAASSSAIGGGGGGGGGGFVPSSWFSPPGSGFFSPDVWLPLSGFATGEGATSAFGSTAGVSASGLGIGKGPFDGNLAAVKKIRHERIARTDRAIIVPVLLFPNSSVRRKRANAFPVALSFTSWRWRLAKCLRRSEDQAVVPWRTQPAIRSVDARARRCVCCRIPHCW